MALVVFTPSCEDARGPVAPRFSAIAWPHEPTGFVTLSDYGFDDPFATGNAVPLGDGWTLYNPNGYATQVTDSGAPLSPPNVGQWSYPVGFVGGDAPAVMYRDLNGSRREMYFGYDWKASNPWEGHPTGVNEISFVIAQDNILVLEMNGAPGGPYHLFRMSTTSTSRDGIVRWWVNGTLVGDYSTVNFDVAHAFDEFHFSPTWGGIGSSKTEEDYFWYDHVRLSVP
ncbi:MAG: hypothetical protein AUH96_09910 [Nitrospirae bacterium 13_2_20CM_2_61_4]|nr:MAG: hypothetical protein AUH96_09910 [Nitrospirae bacterium 13_2_20CM_2_61_4]